MIVICDYCNQPAKLVTGAVIYPNYPDHHGKWFYQCKSCEAYVGCHPNSKRALGRLANKELRTYKMNAHNAFDAIWKRHKKMTRQEAYKWLSEQLGINRSECHIGMFDVEMCNQVIAAVRIYWEDNRKKYAAKGE